uniref:RNase H type-1 domain-containing protein n=1 Tax=Nicotiana tabacum TaxID=4097 RepID=A0A1S4C5Q3_TOBAC|nr:PREDICTED: uncharacterized protein LOC107815202 [Nicotiana tabacum]
MTIEELEAVVLFEQWPERMIYVGANLSSERRASGKFLGFLVSNRGIEVNPSQIKAIEEIPDILTNKKEVQRLTGRIAALGRFISKSSKKCFKFFSALKKQDHFELNEDCQQALKDLKAYLSNPHLLAKPKEGEKLLIYLAVSEIAVSAILVREEQDTETRKVSKMVIELSEYEIIYQPRTAIKSQVLADFVADFSQGMHLEAGKELQVFNGANPGTCVLFTDGSSNVKGAGLGIVLIPPIGETIRQAIKCHPVTNNEAEYEAVIAGLELARELGITQIVIKSDSQLVVNQMLGTYTAREARMQEYLEKVRELIRKFQTWKVMQIPREENTEADALANLASAADIAKDANASVIHLFHSVLEPDKNEYGTVPDNKTKAHALRKKAARYYLHQGNLYRKMFGGPLARCLGPSQTEYIMREINEGHCGNHARGRSLVKTLIRAGYYWPKMEEKQMISYPNVISAKVLWAYRTTAKTSTGETPFSMVYRAEALISMEISETSIRHVQATENSNDEELRVNLDLLEGRGETSLIRMSAQKQVIERYYNRKARLRFFKVGDFVLKKVFQSTKTANSGKLNPTREGPYRVREVAAKGAYELETMDGKVLPSHWNAVHLKRYYF